MSVSVFDNPFFLLKSYAARVKKLSRDDMQQESITAGDKIENNYLRFNFSGIHCAIDTKNIVAVEAPNEKITPLAVHMSWLLSSAVYQSKLMYVMAQNLKELRHMQARAGSGYHLLIVKSAEYYVALLVNQLQQIQKTYTTNQAHAVVDMPAELNKRNFTMINDGVKSYWLIDKNFFSEYLGFEEIK